MRQYPIMDQLSTTFSWPHPTDIDYVIQVKDIM